MGATSRLVTWFGGTPVGVWTIKHLVSPLDRRLYRRTAGRLVTPGHPHGPIVLLTTIGRRTGKERTTPVFHLQDGERVILCNVTPGGERANPWPLNLPIPWPGSSSAPRSEPTGPGRPPRPSSSGIGPSCCGSGRRMSASIGTAAGARCSCSTPPPRSNPNRQSSSRPESCLPRPSLLGHPAPIGDGCGSSAGTG